MQPTLPIYLQPSPYPSLSSPMSNFYSHSRNTPSPKPSVFERLQEDTEKRLRSRLDTYSAPRKFRLNKETPQRLHLSSTLIQRTQSRASSRQSSERDLTFHPVVNQKSQELFNNRYLNKAKMGKESKVLYTEEEYSNPAEIEENVQVMKEKKISHSGSVGKLGQQQIFGSEKPPITDRKYVPMFTKPFDLSKIIGNPGKVVKTVKKVEKQEKSTGIKGKCEVRPLLRPISESSLKTEDTTVYQKIVKDRVEKLKSMKSVGKLKTLNCK